MKYRSVQTGVMAIAFSGIVLLAVILVGYYKYQKDNNDKLYAKELESRDNLIERIIASKEDVNHKVIMENSAWDDLKSYMSESDEEWIEDEIGYMLESYHAALLQVVDLKGSVRYERRDPFFEFTQFFTFKESELATAFKDTCFNKFYFIDEEDNLFQYYAAGIVSSADILTRQEREVGYLVMAIEINDSVLVDYGQSLGNIRVGKVVEKTAVEDLQTQNIRKNQNLIITSKPLNNIYGNPVSFMYFVSDNEVKKLFDNYVPVFVGVSGLCIFLFLLILLYVKIRVTGPLKKIGLAFQDNDSEIVKPMMKNPTEFGILSNQIDTFFTQQNELRTLNRLLEQQHNEVQKKNEELQKQKEEIAIQIENVNVLNMQLSDRNKEMEMKNTKILVQKSQIEEQATALQLHKSQLEELYHQVMTSNKHLSNANKLLTESLDYATSLKNTLAISAMPTKSVFSDFFSLSLAKKQVSGDFYFVKHTENYILVAVGETNEHGAAGAIISSLAMYTLDKTISNYFDEESIPMPHKVLNRMAMAIESIAKDSKLSDDGIYISLFVYNIKSGTAYFASARRSVVIVRKGDSNEFFGDSVSIGQLPEKFRFSCQEITLRPDDKIYLYTDGCTGLVGGPNNHKIMAVNFKKMLVKNAIYSMSEQRKQLKSFFEDWGNGEFSDDITILGFTL